MDALITPQATATAIPRPRLNSATTAFFWASETSPSFRIPARPLTAIPARHTATPDTTTCPGPRERISPSSPLTRGGIRVPKAAHRPPIACNTTPSAGLASIPFLADARDFHVQEAPQLLDLRGDVPEADRAVMRGAVPAPLVHVGPGPDGKSIAAVGVADLEDRPRHALALRHQQLEPPVPRLDHREHGDGRVLHRHLQREAPAHLAVVHPERAHQIGRA